MRSLFLLTAVTVLMVLFGGCGKPPGDTSNNNIAGGSAVTLEATYSSVQKNIFTPICAKCHTGSSAHHGVDLSSYSAIMNNYTCTPKLIVPGDPENSDLYKEVKTGDMPDQAPPLSDAQVQAIYTWIKNGAKESDPAASVPAAAGDSAKTAVAPVEAALTEAAAQMKKDEPASMDKITDMADHLVGDNVVVTMTLNDGTSREYTCAVIDNSSGEKKAACVKTKSTAPKAPSA